MVPHIAARATSSSSSPSRSTLFYRISLTSGSSKRGERRAGLLNAQSPKGSPACHFLVTGSVLSKIIAEMLIDNLDSFSFAVG